MQETIGKRIARLRQQFGWTQQALAARLSISRVAVSHLEMDLTIPGERTVTLLAGLFKMLPYELVEDTTYPKAKAERLPQVTCAYTPLEVDLALLENDLAWLARLAQPDIHRAADEIRQQWAARLDRWVEQTIDEREKELLAAAQQRLQLR
ncbi:MAG: helix-turn-helix transcriptional regulator [Chloroflexota bacterium]